MNKTFLLLGTNQGDRAINLTDANIKISRELGPIITTSSIYKTAAWGIQNQPDFYNQVIVVNTNYDVLTMLPILQQIETEMGRIRVEKWGPRIIDIDILFYNDSIIDLPNLKVPHPEIQNRMFTLKPLAEVAENFIHPVLNQSLLELMRNCTDPLPVEKITL